MIPRENRPTFVVRLLLELGKENRLSFVVYWDSLINRYKAESFTKMGCKTTAETITNFWNPRYSLNRFDIDSKPCMTSANALDSRQQDPQLTTVKVTDRLEDQSHSSRGLLRTSWSRAALPRDEKLPAYSLVYRNGAQ